LKNTHNKEKTARKGDLIISGENFFEKKKRDIPKGVFVKTTQKRRL